MHQIGQRCNRLVSHVGIVVQIKLGQMRKPTQCTRGESLLLVRARDSQAQMRDARKMAGKRVWQLDARVGVALAFQKVCGS